MTMFWDGKRENSASIGKFTHFSEMPFSKRDFFSRLLKTTFKTRNNLLDYCAKRTETMLLASFAAIGMWLGYRFLGLTKDKKRRKIDHYNLQKGSGKVGSQISVSKKRNISFEQT
jgi:hypothetical protein